MVYLITNRNLINEEKYIEHIEKISKEVDYVIFREKDLDEERAYKLVLDILNLIDKDKLIINSFYDIANSVKCYGVHFPYVKYLEHHKKVQKGIKIGVSVHSEEEVISLNQYDDIEYIMFGHIFQSQCKSGVKPRGLEMLGRINNLSKFPVIAVGGINNGNIYDIKEVDIERIALMSEFYSKYSI